MTATTEVRTESTTDKDRQQMREVLRRRLNKKLLLLMPLVLLGIGGMILVNTFDVRFDMTENVRGVWNVVLVVLAAFPLRLAISEIMSYNKDLSHFQIKTARGIVKSVSGQTIGIGNYEFNLSAIRHMEVSTGDSLELKAGYHSSMVFWIQQEAPVRPPATAMA